MYDEDDLLPISALEHLLFCERQAALIHVEQQWTENRLTAEGRLLHTRAHEAATESRGDIRIARGLRLRSLTLGLSGMADVVEFHRLPAGTAGLRLPGSEGQWSVFPVEYKRGRTRPEPAYAVQLCAQALCLEEMLGVAIPAGALFYGKSQHRSEVAFDADIRQQTAKAALRLHELIGSKRTPPPPAGARCAACSLTGICLPHTRYGQVGKYIAGSFTAEPGP